MKSLYEYVSDVGEEVNVEVVAAFDTHNPIARAAIEKCLYGYGLIGRVEDGARKAYAEHPTDFPDLGVVQVFRSKAKVRFAPPSAKTVAQTIAMELKHKDKEVCVKWPGSEEGDAEPQEEVYPRAGEEGETVEAEVETGAQELVGQSRVNSIYKEITKRMQDEQKARSERLKKIVVSQLGLKDIFERDGGRGYYTIVLEKSGELKDFSGPLLERPEGTFVRSREQFEAIRNRIKEATEAEGRLVADA